MKKIFLISATLLLALSACQQTPPLPGQKLGKPYAVDGRTYYPEYDGTYDKVGMASWYGPGFHGKYTASGEIYDQNGLTAAHPTLPMPSLVRVTNLKNGKSIIVRINDRGPFKSNRIIDLSKRAAERLDMPSTSQVRVQFLKAETEEYIASIGTSHRPLSMVAFNERAQRAKDEAIVASTEPADEVENDAPVEPVSSTDLIKPAVAETAMPAPVKFSPPPIMAAGAFAIQAGSFSTEENAHKLGNQLSGIAHMAIDKVSMGEKTWWRVRLGPFKEKEEADTALDRVRAAGQPDARIVRL